METLLQLFWLFIKVNLLSTSGPAGECDRGDPGGTQGEGLQHLVCMGSPHSAHGLRQMYAPNVTAEVAETIGCPVLTVRYQSQGK
jgi:hypothetical protein